MHSPDFLFPCFLVFPPANPSNFSHCKINVFLSGFPFFSVQKYYFVHSIMKCGSGTSRSSVEVQDEKTEETCRTGIIIINVEFMSQLTK